MIKRRFTITSKIEFPSSWYGKCKQYKKCSGRCIGTRKVQNLNGKYKIEILKLKISKKCSLPYKQHNFEEYKLFEELLESKKYDQIDAKDHKILRKIFKWLIKNNVKSSNNDLIKMFSQMFTSVPCLGSQAISSLKQNINKKNKKADDEEKKLDTLKTATNELLTNSVFKFKNPLIL